MGYGNHSRQGQVVFNTTWLAAIATQSAADKAVAQVLDPITVLGLRALITTAMTVTAAVVDYDKRVIPASDTGRVDQGVGRLTLPVTGSAIGQIVYKAVRVDLNPGDEIVLELVTASTAGGAIFGLIWVPRDEVAANYSEMIASA